MNEYIVSKDWSNTIDKNKDIETILNDYIEECETLIKSNMRKKENMTKSTTKDSNNFKSKNKNPREVRKFFKDKRKPLKQ